MKRYAAGAIASASVTAALFAGCSQLDQQISAEKQLIDKQAAAQKQLIERQADRLKEQVERQRARALTDLDTRKEQLDIDKSVIDEQEKSIEKHAAFLKRDIDRQTITDKLQVERNAAAVKQAIDRGNQTAGKPVPRG